MPPTPSRPIVIAAGGTAGHLFPAEALAAVLLAQGREVVLMTDRRTGRRDAGPFAGCTQHVFPVAGMAGKSPLRRLSGALSLLRAGLAARRIVSRLEPAAVVGFGGYGSAPALFGAALRFGRRPRIVLHEGNAILGQANKLFARFADVVATSFAVVEHAGTARQTRLVGFPVRAAIEALAGEPPPDTAGRIEILVWGGSLGARVFADVVPAALALLPAGLRERLTLVQQARAEDLERVSAQYAALGVPARVESFIRDVPERLAASALVIGRAGGSSVAELAMVGRPSIMVPLPIAASDEQGWNARRMEEAGGGWLLRQDRFTPDALAALLAEILAEPDRLAAMATRAHALAQPRSAERLAAVVLDSA